LLTFKFSHPMPYPCTWPACTRECPTPSALQQHLRTHTKEKPFKCAIDGCDFASATKDGLNRHTRTHSGAKPYPCPECNESFASNQSLGYHLRSAHEEGDQPIIKCRFEGCTYPGHWRLKNVREHEATHSKERAHACTHEGCDSRFKVPKHLHAHVRGKHSGHKFKCDRCDFETPWRSCYNDHAENGHDPVTGERVRNGRECRVLTYLKAVGINGAIEEGVRIDCDGEPDRPYIRVDAMITRGDLTVLFEVDEGQHKDTTKYTVNNELARMEAGTRAVSQISPHVLWVRFNPDVFTVNNVRGEVPLEARVQQAADLINSYVPTEDVAVVYMFYDEVNGVPILLSHPHYHADARAAVIVRGRPRGTAAAAAHQSDSEPEVAGGARANCSEMVECPQCSKKLTAESLSRHIRTIHEGKTRKREALQHCTFPGCKKSYTQSHSLKTHIEVEHEGAKWECDLCKPMSYHRSKSNLATHKKILHRVGDRKLHRCKHCEFDTPYTQSMRKHMDRHHPGMNDELSSDEIDNI
jgi:hypothetical protein